MKLLHSLRLFGLMLMLVFQSAQACAEMETAPPSTFKRSGVAEVGSRYALLDKNNQDWIDQYLLGGWQFAEADRINGEISHQSHFDDQGVFFGVGYTHIFNEDWYGSLSTGTSLGGFFLPQFRIDAVIYKKWLAKKSLVTGVGFTYYRAKDVHYDYTLTLNAVYYFDAPWIIELGARLNQSNPGAVRADRVFGAVTYGRNKDYYLTARYEAGQEGYQLVGAGTTISNFFSREGAFIWRQWVSRDYGFNWMLNYYDNPNYSRFIVTLGLFVDF